MRGKALLAQRLDAAGVDALYIGAHGLLGLFALVAYLSSGLENVRTFLGERSTKYGANTIVSSLLFLAILGALNYVSARHHHRFDLTEEHVFSLSPQSVSVVKSLPNELQIQAFVEGGVNPELRDLLSNYAYQSPKIKFELIDPDRQPELAEKYKISAYNTVRLQYGEESTTITQPTEENLTNAIIKVTRTTHKVVCMIDGHGEPDMDSPQDAHGISSLKTGLTNENYEVKKVLRDFGKAFLEAASKRGRPTAKKSLSTASGSFASAGIGRSVSPAGNRSRIRLKVDGALEA